MAYKSRWDGRACMLGDKLESFISAPAAKGNQRKDKGDRNMAYQGGTVASIFYASLIQHKCQGKTAHQYDSTSCYQISKKYNNIPMMSQTSVLSC